MWIEGLMQAIWKPWQQRYRVLLDQAMEKSTDQLIAMMREQMDHARFFFAHGQHAQMTSLITRGCAHWNDGGQLSGCSFCDFFSKNLRVMAVMEALRKKDPKAYAATIRYGFVQFRGNGQQALPVEHITAFDTMNDEEVGEEAFEALFDSQTLFRSGLEDCIIEARITSITTEKLEKFRRRVKGRLMIESGVETADDWLRNHWLNKRLRDEQLFRSWEKIHDAGCLVLNDLLIGLPGLTDRQSISFFQDSFHRLQGADTIVVSPLLRKGNDLQSNLYQLFRDDPELTALGVSQGEMTGVPHLMSVLQALYQTLRENSEDMRRLIFSPGHLRAYCNFILYANKKSPHYSEIRRLIDGLIELSEQRQWPLLEQLYRQAVKTDYYRDYQTQIERQAGPEQIKQTLHCVAEKLNRHFLQEQEIHHFEEELQAWHTAPEQRGEGQ